MDLEIKKTKGSMNKKKITLSINAEVYEIYCAGKRNEWDTPEFAVQAVEAAILGAKEKLLKKAS